MKKTRRRPRIDRATHSAVNAFLEGDAWKAPGLETREGWERMYWHSYLQWKHGGRAWEWLELGGTRIVRALMWYHHKHKPGSKEWRPSIIIAARVEASREAAGEKSTA